MVQLRDLVCKKLIYMPTIFSSFMFQLLDKLSEYGGAENLNFDWWSPKEMMAHAADKTEDTDNANKANIQQILLSICYKVSI